MDFFTRDFMLMLVICSNSGEERCVTRDDTKNGCVGDYCEVFFAPCNGIRNPESREIFMLESGIQDIF